MTQSLKVFTFSLLNFLSLILTETLETPLHCHQKKHALGTHARTIKCKKVRVMLLMCPCLVLTAGSFKTDLECTDWSSGPLSFSVK